MIRLKFILFSIFVFNFSTPAQTSRYSDREFYVGPGIKFPLVSAPGDQVHLWSFERYRVRVHQFDRDLKYGQSRIIKSSIKAGFRFEFLKFHSFYYMVMSDSLSSGIYRIESDGTINDQTEQVLSKLSLRELRPYYFTKGVSQIFLIQRINDDASSNTVINIHTFDSAFNYQNKMALKVPYLKARAQDMELSSIGDELFLLSHTKNKRGVLAFSITKIDALNGTLATKLFHTENLEFIEHRLFETVDGVVLESEVKEQKIGNLPEHFTYLIKMDRDLQVTHSLFLTSDKLKEVNSGRYFFRRAITVDLPDKRLLNISFGRKKDENAEGSPELYRFVSIDSNFNIAHSFIEPSERGKFAPTLSLRKDKDVQFYYEEPVRNHVSMIRKFQVKNSILDDLPVLLNVKFRYDLSSAVVCGTSFVMPYYRKGNIGLVRVRM